MSEGVAKGKIARFGDGERRQVGDQGVVGKRTGGTKEVNLQMRKNARRSLFESARQQYVISTTRHKKDEFTEM